MNLPIPAYMKYIGLLSDTHSFLDPKVLEHFNDCDEIWHAGDIGNLAVAERLEQFKPFKAVYGNIDDAIIRRAFPLDLRFTCENLDVWITHIGGYPGRYKQRIRKVMMENPPGLFICGHSHILKIMADKQYDLIHINPGACGNHGFHKMKTIVRFKIDHGKLFDVEVIEFGARGKG